MRELGFGKGLHGQVLKKGEAFLDGFLENSLVNMYSSYGILEDSVLIFYGIEKLCMVAWSSMLGAYVKNGFEKKGLNLFFDMIFKGIELDVFVLSVVIKSFHTRKNCRKSFDSFAVGVLSDLYTFHRSTENSLCPYRTPAWKVFHSLAKKLDVHSDPYVTSALIDMFFKCGKPEATLRVFERVEDPCTVTWSTLISGLSWNGWFVEALTCFQKMQLNGIEANEFTLTFVILASVALASRQMTMKWFINFSRGFNCALVILNQSPFVIFSDCVIASAFAFEMQAQAYMAKRGLFSHPMSGNGLIQMYSECGQIAEANLAFELLPEKTSPSWTSIISAKVKHGHPSEALALFNDMRRRNKLMDSSTLKSILKACGRMG
ncbi:hypothetical protein V6N11_071453 [Hibiscus sabdariffa]|uniref:Pentatricopeptide repeat-containing protein n=1 Tax=Hibiscus sabdariffa TaxID=183260 RepID=A0ABR2U0T9_9ROSI